MPLPSMPYLIRVEHQLSDVQRAGEAEDADSRRNQDENKSDHTDLQLGFLSFRNFVV